MGFAGVLSGMTWIESSSHTGGSLWAPEVPVWDCVGVGECLRGFGALRCSAVGWVLCFISSKHQSLPELICMNLFQVLVKISLPLCERMGTGSRQIFVPMSQEFVLKREKVHMKY